MRELARLRTPSHALLTSPFTMSELSDLSQPETGTPKNEIPWPQWLFTALLKNIYKTERVDGGNYQAEIIMWLFFE